MSRYTEFTDLAVNYDGASVTWRHRLLAPDGSILASTDEADDATEWGAEARPLVYDSKGSSHRLATLHVRGIDPALVPDAQGAMHPDSGNEGYRVTLDAGLYVDGSVSWQRQATMLVDEVDATDSGVVDLTADLVDVDRPIRSQLPVGFRFDEGETVSAVVERLLGLVLDAYQVAPTTHTVPSGSIGAGQPVDQYVTEFLDGIGHELVCTPEGLVVTRPIPATSDDSTAEYWRYGQSDGIEVDRARRLWTVRTPQAWRVEGGSFQDPNPPITFTVYDTDPTSAGYFAGNKPAQIRTLRAPFITNLAQAADAGYGQLRKHGIGPMHVEIWSVPNPGVRVGDLVELERPALNASGRFRIVDYRLPQQNEELMRLTLRKVYDPAKNFQPPNPGNEACVASHSDDFNRADENLENLPPGSPGSPDWEEHGWSWNIRRNTAVQIYGDGWCLGFRKTPLCAANHYTEIVVDQLPAGRYVGPVARCSGRFDGYVFMAAADGRVSLERWLNGARAVTLASTTGYNVAGSTMRIEAEGRTITGKIDGSSVLTATDDAATGTHVGMLGYGGWDPNGPGVDSFAAGAL